MPKYPLEWGPHLDSDTTDNSNTPDLSPPTERYPLEWGYHLDSDPKGPSRPQITPTMLDGDADVGKTPREKEPAEARQECHEECAYRFLGKGFLDTGLRYRRCMRECLGRKGYHGYLVEPK